MNCQSCNDTKFVDIRLPYKAPSYVNGMIDYVPLYILCPFCAKKYKCPECNSEKIDFKFLKMPVDCTIGIGCKECGNTWHYD